MITKSIFILVNFIILVVFIAGIIFIIQFIKFNYSKKIKDIEARIKKPRVTEFF